MQREFCMLELKLMGKVKQVERICHLKWGRLWSAETAEIRRPMRKVEAVLPARDDGWV
jgi:hypothetical protein